MEDTRQTNEFLAFTVTPSRAQPDAPPKNVKRERDEEKWQERDKKRVKAKSKCRIAAQEKRVRRSWQPACNAIHLLLTAGCKEKPSLELSAFNKRKSFLPQSLCFPLRWHLHTASVTVKTLNRQVQTMPKNHELHKHQSSWCATQCSQPEIAGKNMTIHD
jgi:hypothetical protein